MQGAPHGPGAGDVTVRTGPVDGGRGQSGGTGPDGHPGGRRGLATAATEALTDAAFGLPGIDRVEIVHDELNAFSEAVPRKLGFTRAGQRALDVVPEAGNGLGIVWRMQRRVFASGAGS